MAFDLGALMKGGNQRDIAETLSSTTPAGDLLFKEPFGDSTVWTTDTGFVRVTVLFDPLLPWGKANILASTTDDLLASIRQSLGVYLCKDKMAPTMTTRKEIFWEKLRTALPDKVFAEYVNRDSTRLDEYIGLVNKAIDQQFTEDQSMREAMMTKKFNFTYHLAVDAYPQEKQKKRSGVKEDGNSTSNKGVLVFHIEGYPENPIEESVGKIGIDVASPPTSPRVTPMNVKKPTLRNLKNSNSQKSQLKLESLLSKLDLSAEKVDCSHNVWTKSIPDTTAEFFEQIGSWFFALLERKEAQLSDAEGGNQANMYR
mmetsp:Transcript_5685/g.8838  ORF Transcript_5685/g.8838 Transcript_5685/m.8838 type:complete len:313 (+) Transcript_5685:311-1249(+)|eukprot:CAMPEP_0203773300 /NCGR_PEP_ID=MMETSP0099_2-20121227/4576_1 /ASSEMBLY_ACC=CAM_ASM_000209 /TAXON_ID=96639 /ORGANISM=" , Strain NY0313808BC1" /LENGTH=312 /DNA_ID=CAMNT_0050671105 /DNA_START=283 /DNA_END=1221 /DNA_ORIENTATION=-